MLNALNKYESLRSAIDRCNDAVLETLRASTVHEAKIAAESFTNGGKRLRPALMILSSMLHDGKPAEEAPAALIELAAAVELIHLATLFHDDVIDEVEMRRSSLSARAKYGNYVSVLAGDYALSEALLLVNRSGIHQTMPEFLRTIRVLVSGESRETNHKFDFDMNEAIYYEIISEKSASLFSLSCKAGALYHDSGYADVLGHFGWHLGMAFQMIDDLDDMLDLPNGNMDCDLKNGYLALPIIHVLSALRDGHRTQVIDLIRQGEFTADVQRRIISTCTDQGGVQHTHREIERHLERSAAALSPFADNPARRLLESVVSDLMAYSNRQVTGYLRVHDACA